MSNITSWWHAELIRQADEDRNIEEQFAQIYFVETSLDDGKTWSRCSGFVSEQEAISIKRSIDHNTLGLTIDVRVSKMQ